MSDDVLVLQNVIAIMKEKLNEQLVTPPYRIVLNRDYWEQQLLDEGLKEGDKFEGVIIEYK